MWKLLTCDRCKIEFIPARSDEEAIKEFIELNPGRKYDPKNCATICDPCFRLFKKWFDTLSEKQHKQILTEQNK